MVTKNCNRDSSKRDNDVTADELEMIAAQLQEQVDMLNTAIKDLKQGPGVVNLGRSVTSSGSNVQKSLVWIGQLAAEAVGKCAAAKWNKKLDRGE